MASLLNGRYELGDVLGSGGMGQVWRATDTRLARPVAVKILRSGADQDPTARARFRSEAQLAGSLHHPGIAQIYDVGEDESTPEHDPFIVMQLIEGTPLSQVLRERRTLPPDEVTSIIGQVADALDSAHAASIVHRDLKPSNIIITAAGRAVLVDFGIAWSATSEPLTATGSIIGTAEYFSPEQATGRPATARSDLYSLGVVAHHCLSGESPFRRDTPVATAMAQLHDPLPTLSETVPATLRTLVTALTQKNPDDRPSSAALVASLATAEHPPTAVLTPPLADDAGTGPIPVPVATPFDTGPATTSEQPAAGYGAPQRPVGRYVAVAVAVVVLVLAAGLGIAALGGDPDDAPTATGTPTPTPSASTEATDGGGGDAGGSDPSVPAEETTTVDADALIGLTFADAAAMLTDLGLEVRRVDAISTDSAGTVTAVDPAGEVPDGSTITLTVATEAPTETTPTPDPTVDTPGGPGEPKKDEAKGKGKKAP